MQFADRAFDLVRGTIFFLQTIWLLLRAVLYFIKLLSFLNYAKNENQLWC
jgi:hypothetical protein